MIIIIFFLKKIGSVWLTRILLLISKVNVRCIPYEKKTKKNNPKVNMFKGNFKGLKCENVCYNLKNLKKKNERKGKKRCEMHGHACTE